MRSLFAILAALAALLMPAAAQQPTQAQASAIRQACRADYPSHCASVPTGGMAALQCLQANEASLSPPCRQAVAAVGGNGGSPGTAAATSPAGGAPPSTLSLRDEMRMLRTDCGADYRRWCSDVRLGGGRALGCLHAHDAQVSPLGRSALQAMPAGH
jgi:hypothetical protein